MKLCAIQIPYGKNKIETENSVKFLIDELNSCDDSFDLILTPEYSNGPGELTPDEALDFYISHTEELVNAAIAAARRCNAAVALSGCFKIGETYRNTTRIYAPDGSVAGEYYKQQLVLREPSEHGVDNAYTREWNPPPIVEVNGVRYGFLTCYDAYFEEYIAHLGYRRPDVVLVSAFQRGEPMENLRMMNQMLAYHTGAFVLRSSVSMGENTAVGGTSLVVDPAGKILADMGCRVGKLTAEIADVHYKYCRSNSYGGSMIKNFDFIDQGRTPWNYRPAGSCVKPDDSQMGYPRICAHRGFNSVAPENSLPAFGAAIALGADEIEFDVRFSADGVPVSVHDNNLERVANGSGLVEDFTFEELQQFDFGIKRGAEFSGLRILKFEEILRRFPRQCIMNIHVKTAGEKYFSREKMQKIINLIYEYDCAKHVYFKAGYNVMEAALELAPEIHRCMGAEFDGEKMQIVENAIKYKCRKVQFFTPYFTQELIDYAHENGIKCNFFYTDDPDEARKLLDMGIDTILTNDYFRISQVRDAWLKER